MAVSKGTIAAGIIGSGGGIVGTTVVVKYVDSKSEIKSEQVEKEFSKGDANPASNSTAETLKQTKDAIKAWGQKPDNGNCTIKVQLANENVPKGLDEITDVQKEIDLKKLLTVLGTETPNSEAKSICEKAKSDATKYLLAKQGASTNPQWTFEGPKP